MGGFINFFREVPALHKYLDQRELFQRSVVFGNNTYNYYNYIYMYIPMNYHPCFREAYHQYKILVYMQKYVIIIIITVLLQTDTIYTQKYISVTLS